MMGRLDHDQEQLFYSFCLDEQSRTITRFARLLRFSIYLGFVPSLRPFTPK
jgi:hypothetical protein